MDTGGSPSAAKISSGMSVLAAFDTDTEELCPDSSLRTTCIVVIKQTVTIHRNTSNRFLRSRTEEAAGCRYFSERSNGIGMEDQRRRHLRVESQTVTRALATRVGAKK